MFGWGGYGGWGYEESGPWGSEPVSKRALGKLDEAKKIFDKHIAEVDVSAGPVGGV